MHAVRDIGGTLHPSQVMSCQEVAAEVAALSVCCIFSDGQFQLQHPQAVMGDPVVLEGEGWSYERPAIRNWLLDHDVSPVTGLPLASRELITNHTLRSFIQRLTDRGADLTPTVRFP